MKKNVVYLLLFFTLSMFYACIDPCKDIECLNDGNCVEGTCVCPDGFQGEFCEIALAYLNCGSDWQQSCLNDHWQIDAPSTTDYELIPDLYQGQDGIFITNEHSPVAVNPPPILFNTTIKNIKENASYRVSCNAKIKGYPDFVNNPGFTFYAYTTDNWYGQMYYNSPGGAYHDKDWDEFSYLFIGGPESTIHFQLYSLYDSLWVTDLKIEEI